MNIDKNESAVVIIGSGAGGGQMAHQLTKEGIACVCFCLLYTSDAADE